MATLSKTPLKTWKAVIRMYNNRKELTRPETEAALRSQQAPTAVPTGTPGLS